MTCPCDDVKKKMPKCDAGTPPVIEVNSHEMPVLFHTINIPASMGDISTLPPTPGAYRNTRVHYEVDNQSYLYDSDGIPQLLSGGESGVTTVNGMAGAVILNAADVGALTEAQLDARLSYADTAPTITTEGTLGQIIIHVDTQNRTAEVYVLAEIVDNGGTDEYDWKTVKLQN